MTIEFIENTLTITTDEAVSGFIVVNELQQEYDIPSVNIDGKYIGQLSNIPSGNYKISTYIISPQEEVVL